MIILTALFLLLALGVSLVSYSIVLHKKPTTPIPPDKPSDTIDNPDISYTEKIAKSYICTFYEDEHHIIHLEKDGSFTLKNREILLEKGTFTVQVDGSIELSLFGSKYWLKPDLANSLMHMVSSAKGDYTEYSNQVGEYVYKLRLYNEGYARLFIEGSRFNVYGSYTKDDNSCTLTFLNENSVIALYKENGANKFKSYDDYQKEFYYGDYECSFMNNATLILLEKSFRIHNGATLFEGNAYDLSDDELCLYIGNTTLIVELDGSTRKASLKDITEGEGVGYTYYSKAYNESYYFSFYPNGTYTMTSTNMGYTLYGYYKVFSQSRYYVICLKSSAMMVLDDGKLYLATEYVEDESIKFSFENNVEGVVEYELSIVEGDSSFTLTRKLGSSLGVDEHKGNYTINSYGISLSNTFYGLFKDKLIILDYENHLFKLVKNYQYTDINGKKYTLSRCAIDDDNDKFTLTVDSNNSEIFSCLVDKNTFKEGFTRLSYNDNEYLIWVEGNNFIYAETLLGVYYYNDSGVDYLKLNKDLTYELSFNGNIEGGVYTLFDSQIVLSEQSYVTLSPNRFTFTKDRVISATCTLPNSFVKGDNVDLSSYTITLRTLLGEVYQGLLTEIAVEGFSTDIEGSYECTITFREYTYTHSYNVIVEAPSYLEVVNLPDTITLGEGINLANAIVNVISDLGRVIYSSAIDQSMFTNLDINSIGNKSATLTYKDLTYTYNYTVVSNVYDVEIVSLTMPKNIFSVGEEIDLNGARIRIRTNLNGYRYENVTPSMLVGFSTDKACSGVFTIEYNGMRYVGGAYTVKGIPQSYELTVDVTLTTTAGIESDTKYMTNAYFVALTDGAYRFESKSQYGIRAYLYDEDMNLLAYDYAGQENSIDFVIEYTLKQGERVLLYYRVDSDQNEQIEIVATKIS